MASGVPKQRYLRRKYAPANKKDTVSDIADVGFDDVIIVEVAVSLVFKGQDNKVFVYRLFTHNS